MAVTQTTVTASGGGEIPCIAAFPGEERATAVVVVPSIFGVDGDMAMIAERLAEEGYIGVVLDPFWRDEDAGSSAMTKKAERVLSPAWIARRLNRPSAI